MTSPPLLGSWARTGDLVGLVARVGPEEVTLFSPGERRQVTVPLAAVEAVPAGALDVSVTVTLPVPHGIGEDHLRRWVASLVDDDVRARALAVLAGKGLDAGAGLPGAELSVRPSGEEAAVCLCGARTPAARGTQIACSACGRQAAAPPATSGGGLGETLR